MHKPEPARSRLMKGLVGRTVAPTRFPKSNYIIDARKYDYEGNWAFSYFGQDDVHAARFGFGVGKFDAGDYGHRTPVSKDFMLLQIELMTSEGAYLWLGNGKYKSSELRTSTAQMDNMLIVKEKRLVSIIGWPKITWKMESDDGDIGVDMVADLSDITLLPDNMMPNNIFSMWLATGHIAGEVFYSGKRVRVGGEVFYDHPRINVVANKVPQIGWYLYVPIAFRNGAKLAGYYTTHKNDLRDENYCFALYTSPQAEPIWMTESRLVDLGWDANGVPSTWTIEWRAADAVARVQARVEDCSVSRAWGHSGWGGGGIPQTRAENKNMPLVFTCEATMRSRGEESTVLGGGVAEFVRNIS